MELALAAQLLNFGTALLNNAYLAPPICNMIQLSKNVDVLPQNLTNYITILVSVAHHGIHIRGNVLTALMVWSLINKVIPAFALQLYLS
jgi:hypothetical protein